VGVPVGAGVDVSLEVKVFVDNAVSDGVWLISGSKFWGLAEQALTINVRIPKNNRAFFSELC
jgi:hypothetical protein